jgi:hypothetical protein
MMDFFRRLLETEPTDVIGTLTSLLALAVNFGLPLTGVQVDAIVQFATNALLLGGAIFAIRRTVYAPDTTQAIANRAAATGDTDIGTPPSGPVGGDIEIDESEKE